jgi:LmbE family N-acetylglucosaminyl deacetylase
MNAIVLVAHPDDFIIFASAYMAAHPEHNWSITYLTHWRFQKRGREITRYWRKRGVKTKFLGFEDNVEDLRQGKCITWPKETAIKALQSAVDGYELILTHGEDGEYGHPHHLIIYEAINTINKPKVYFSNNSDLMYPIPKINFAELPRHTKSIEIHTASGISSYKEVL